MWNDKETNIDLVGHSSIAKTIETLVLDSDLCPLTVGIYGDWGAGKSSVLRMINENLANQEGVCCVTFNGWQYQGYEDAKAALMQQIISALEESQPTSTKVKKKANQLLKQVDWLKAARHTAGFVISTAVGIPDISLISSAAELVKKVSSGSNTDKEEVEKLSKALNELKKAREYPSSVVKEVEEFRKGFEELLKTAKISHLIVLVDDLDRCLPQTVIEVLEAIRLFLSVPGSVFVIAADEELMSYCVRQHFPAPESSGHDTYAKSYLEKLVQVPLRIPPLGKTQVRMFVMMLLCQEALKNDVGLFTELQGIVQNALEKPWDLSSIEAEISHPKFTRIHEVAEAMRLSEHISYVLAEGLKGNPRQVKRFLNTLMLRLRIAEAHGLKESVTTNVLAKLMLLERFRDEIYRELSDLAGQSVDGSVKDLTLIESAEVADLFSNEETTKLRESLPASWSKDDWLLSWASIHPSLANVDLRPYVFISREKTPGFVSEGGLSGELDELLRLLSTGQPLIISSQLSKIKTIGADSSAKLFTALLAKAKKEPSWKQKPQQFEGLYALAKSCNMGKELLIALEGWPAEDLGPWAATKLTSIIEGDSQERMRALIKKWSDQTGNQALRISAKNVLDIKS